MGENYIYLDRDTEFHGEVITDHLVLSGKIEGEVYARGVVLQQGAVVKGEISTKKIVVEEGTLLDGCNLHMEAQGNGKKRTPDKEKPDPKASKEDEESKSKNGDRKYSEKGSASTTAKTESNKVQDDIPV